jgi:hypothetical protein
VAVKILKKSLQASFPLSSEERGADSVEVYAASWYRVTLLTLVSQERRLVRHRYRRESGDNPWQAGYSSHSSMLLASATATQEMPSYLLRYSGTPGSNSFFSAVMQR